MDTSAYLRKQGWRGEGHSLDHTDRGIKKPLLVSKKVDVLGVGLNKHAAVSDQWWLRAFDQGLKNLGTGNHSVLADVQKHGINRGGLYGRFVRGEGHPGSIGQTPASSEAGTGASTPTQQPQITTTMPGLIMGDTALAGAEGSRGRKRKHVEEDGEQGPSPKVVKQGEDERKLKRKIKQKTKVLILEAQRVGVLPLAPDQNQNRIHVVDRKDDSLPQLSKEMRKILKHAGLSEVPDWTGLNKSSAEAQRQDRRRMERQFKRAAKAYLLRETHPHLIVEAQRKRREKDQKRQNKLALKEENEMVRAKEKERRREEKRERKQAKRLQKAAAELSQHEAEHPTQQTSTTIRKQKKRAAK